MDKWILKIVAFSFVKFEAFFCLMLQFIVCKAPVFILFYLYIIKLTLKQISGGSFFFQKLNLPKHAKPKTACNVHF